MSAAARLTGKHAAERWSDPAGPRPVPALLADSTGDLSYPNEQDEPRALAAGTLIQGSYRVVRLLGRGGHGEVYEAAHLALGYPVAIKVLPPLSASDSRRRERFRREALLGARLRHRNIVHVYDVGELEDGSPFLVMEYVDGIDLASLIDRGRLDVASTVDVGVQLLAAVIALYDRGVIHRDIKPNNVMLQRSVDGYVEVKLLDFGISKALKSEVAVKTLTADDCVLGTPQYMSPEQARGGALDVRADLYSVGALLYECLAGDPVFDGESPGAVLARILTEEAPSILEARPDLPPEIAAVIDRALRKTPADRWKSPLEMSEALRAAARSIALPRGADAWHLVLGREPASVGLRSSSSLSPGEVSPTVEASPRPAGTGAIASGGSPVRTSVPPLSLGAFSGRLWWSRARALGIGASAAVVVATSLAFSAGSEGDSVEVVPEARAAAAASKPPAPTPVASNASPRQEERPVVARYEPEPVVRAQAPDPEGIEANERTEAEREPQTASRSRRDTRRETRSTPVASAAALERDALEAFLAGRDREAVQLYGRATRSSPSRASAWRGLGVAAAAAGDRRTAIRALSRYLELAPTASDRPQIQSRLASLSR